MSKRKERKPSQPSEWASLLASALSEGSESPPPGFKTSKQIAAESNRSLSHTIKQLLSLVEAGAVERKEFRISTGKRPYPVPHYRIIR